MPRDDMPLMTEEKPQRFLQSLQFRLPMDNDILDVEFTHPGKETGMIIFAEERAEDRDSYDQSVADILNKHDLATLLPDPPAFDELHFDIFQLADRLEHIVLWAEQAQETAGLSFGCYASGTMAAAALIVAARQPKLIKAVVLRGGLADEVHEYLPLIKAPVLLITAGRDPVSQRSGRRALEKLNSLSTMNVIPNASPSFQEPGVMEQSAQLAALWFLRHM